MTVSVLSFHSSKLKWLAPALLFLLAACLRWLMAIRSGLYCDESLCVFIANLPKVTDTFNFLRFHESHPPLFYLILRLWSALFGLQAKSLLLLPVLAGSLATVVVYYGARQIYNVRAAVIAALLVCLSPGMLDYSSQVRPYALLQTLVPLGCWMLWQIRQGSPLLPRLLGWTVISLASLYLHNWGWIAVGAQIVCFCLSLSTTHPIKAAIRQVVGLALAIAVMLVFYLPWLPTLLHQASVAGYGGISRKELIPHATSGLFSLLEFSTQQRLATTQKKAIILWGCVALVLLVAFNLDRQRNGKASIRYFLDQRKAETHALLLFGGTAIVALVAAAVLSSKNDLLQTKSLSMLLPGVYLILGAALSALAETTQKAFKNKAKAKVLWAVGTLCTYAVIALSIAKQDVTVYRTSKSWARESAQYLTMHILPGDLIVVVPEWFCSSFNWYYRNPTPQICYPALHREEVMQYDHVIERFSDPVAFLEAQKHLAQVREQGHTVWLVTLHGVADHVKEQPVAVTPDLPLQTRDYQVAGYLRSAQLYSYLKTLYGTGTQIPLHQEASNRTDYDIDVYKFSR